MHSDVKANPAIIDELLSGDFEEIGSTGYAASRDEVVKWLQQKDSNDRWELQDFRIRSLSPDLLLAIYRAKKITLPTDASGGSLRSSIWQRCGGRWKMVFHQASKIIDE